MSARGARPDRAGRGERADPGGGLGHGLTGAGPSQLGTDGAMRVRDVSRPRPADEQRAEELVEVSYRPRYRPGASGSGGRSPVAS